MYHWSLLAGFLQGFHISGTNCWCRTQVCPCRWAPERQQHTCTHVKNTSSSTSTTTLHHLLTKNSSHPVAMEKNMIIHQWRLHVV